MKTSNLLSSIARSGFLTLSALTFSWAAPDTTPPTILQVTAEFSSSNIVVYFSEPVDSTSAVDKNNYSVNGQISSSAMLIGPQKVKISSNSGLQEGYPYTLVVSNIADKATPPNYCSESKPFRLVPAASGLNYSYYETTVSQVPDFTTLTATSSGVLDSVTVEVPNRRADNFALQLSGAIFIMEEGQYTFYLSSDEGSKLWIDSSLVVSNDGVHTVTEVSGTKTLTFGYHEIEIGYFEKTGAQSLTLSMMGTNFTKQQIPAMLCAHKKIFTGDMVTFTSPLPGQHYAIGDSLPVQWTLNTPIPTGLQFLITFNDGIDWPGQMLTGAIRSDSGSFKWKIPATFGNPATSTISTTVKIKAQEYSGDRSLESGTFSIATVGVKHVSEVTTASPVAVRNAGNGQLVLNISKSVTPVAVSVFTLTGQIIEQKTLPAGQAVSMPITRVGDGQNMLMLRIQYNGQNIVKIIPAM